MTPDTDLERLAKSLTAAQRDVILNGYQMRHSIVTLRSLVGMKLMGNRVCHPDGNGWPLTAKGTALRFYLERQSHVG